MFLCVSDRVESPYCVIGNPRRVVTGETDRKLLQFGPDRQTPVSFPKSRAVKLLGDQSAMPFEDRLRADDGHRVGHEFAEDDDLLARGASLVVGKENALVNLVAQDTVLFQQIPDSAQQVFVHTSGDVRSRPRE
jgi:hypothetical protein